MKRVISFALCCFFIFTFNFNVIGIESDEFAPLVFNNNVTSDEYLNDLTENDTRASGLIFSYGLSLSKENNVLDIYGVTKCTIDVVRSGFKNFTIQRRATSSDSWEDYYEYGNIYLDSILTNFSTTLVVERGYQYRISCKHYAKKSLFVTQTISNTSNIVTVS